MTATAQHAIQTDRAAPPRGPYSQGVRWEQLIFTASVGPANPQLGDPPAGDVRAATRGALENIKAIVGAGGGSLATVLKVTCYLRDAADYDAVNEVYHEYFAGTVLPARALVPVPGARSPVSFDAIAYRP
jgi:2-iminobutanoate/2-iminopropanoate deaminase